MATTLDRKTGILAGIIVALLVVVAFLAGSLLARTATTGPFWMQPFGGMGMHDVEAGNGNLSGSDVMFLQMMIPHHEQAVEMSDLALATSTDEELLALAREIRDGQAREIEQMKAWLSEDGLAGEFDHPMGMGMGGMLTGGEIRTLEAASGAEFDTLWLEGMIQHHAGALHMIEMIEDSGNPEMVDFAASIDSVQRAQIEQMQVMLERLGS